MVMAKSNGFEPKHKLAGANQQQLGPFWYCRLQICWEALASETGILTLCQTDLLQCLTRSAMWRVGPAGCLHPTTMKGISLGKTFKIFDTLDTARFFFRPLAACWQLIKIMFWHLCIKYMRCRSCCFLPPVMVMLAYSSIKRKNSGTKW